MRPNWSGSDFPEIDLFSVDEEGEEEEEPWIAVKKSNLVSFLIIALALVQMLGFCRGRNTVGGPVRVVVQKTGGDVMATEERVSEPPSRFTFTVNINTATVEELVVLPGIGETRAQAIVAYREEHGPFACVEDLVNVNGIGEGILANIKDIITVGEEDNGEDLSG